MKVKVIGGGGAFSVDNSSFLITIDAPKYYKKKATVLFDCGSNAFHYCKENEIVPDAVFISHTHFDHIGGLEQLAYWSYFMMGQPLNVVAAPPVYEEIHNIFKNVNYVYDNGKMIDAQIMDLHTFFDSVNITEDSDIFDFELYNFKFVEGNHVIKPNYGLLITDVEAEHSLLITGDTKASKTIVQAIVHEIQNGRKITIFHDYQGNCNPFESAHCCKEDFDLYYKNLPMQTWIKWYLYHNEEFNKKYKGTEIKIISKD